MESLISLLDVFLDNVLASSAVIAVVAEFALRLVKSPKPLSVLHGVAGALKLISALFAKAADVLDKILPRREPEVEAEKK